jgi:TolB-like protein
MSVEQDVCSAEMVRDELRRILSSGNFTTSDRNRRFLEYVIEETLAGRAARLKAYNIATTVFGRPDSFDPQMDPVVRMEAGRLRRALERFYLLDPNAVGTIRLAMPKGGYVPEFRPTAAHEEKEQLVSSGPPSILVAPFEPEGDPALLLNLHLGFTRQVIICLHQLGDGIICDPYFTPARASEKRSGAAAGSGDRILTGDVAVIGEALSVTALLVHASTGRVLWGSAFQRTVSRRESILVVRDEVADCVARALHEHLRGASTGGRDDGLSIAPDADQNGRTERTEALENDPNAHPLMNVLLHRVPLATH